MTRWMIVSLVAAAVFQTSCSSTAGADSRIAAAEDAPAIEAGKRAAPEGTGTPSAPNGVVRMRGLFAYMADAATFVDCRTGERLPVAMEADYLALERAYLDNREEPGRPLLVIIDGYVAERPAMEGDGIENVVIVDRFVEIRVGELCEPGKPDVALRNTYWKLMTIGGRPVEVTSGQREPHIILDLREMSFKGYGGCNQLMGGFQMDGNNLTFGRIGSTKRYCTETMELERSFLQALGTVTRFDISGETLTLYRSEEIIALLEARYFD